MQQSKKALQIAAQEDAQKQSLHTEVADLIARTQATLVADLADTTHQAYSSDWFDFQTFSTQLERPVLPASAALLVLYIQKLVDAKLKLNSIRRRLAAIRYYHFEAGYDSPTETALAKKMMRAVSRQLGYQLKQKQALYLEDLKQMIDSIDTTQLQGLRDRAMLLLGFAGGFRRSELVTICHEHLFFEGVHLRVHVPRSKTDQSGKGMDKPIFGEPNSPYCPVIALKLWLQCSGIKSGYIFRRIRRGQRLNLAEDKALSAVSYVKCIKYYAEKMGLDPDMLGGHSLRSGFVTSAALQGKDALHIADVTKQDIRTVQRYMRKARMFEQHAGEDFWK